MQYSGFPSIHAYEQECARIGHDTQRIPFRKHGADYFVLVSHPPGGSGASCSAWSLIDMSETTELASGIISSQQILENGALQNNVDVNYLGKLSGLGYYPAAPADPKTARPEERGKALYLAAHAPQELPAEDPRPVYAEVSEPADDHAQLSLFAM